MASSAHDRLPLTANLGLRDQIFALPWLKCPSLGGDADGFFSPWEVEPGRGGRSVISMAPPSWPGALGGASKIVNAPAPRLPQGGCCLRTVPCGRGMWRYPHHADGHCRTAADLMANLALRRPPATARPSRRDHLRRGPAVFRGECERGAARPGVRAATGSARWPPLSRVGGCHGGRQFARRHGRVLGADRFFAGDSVSAGIAGGAQINHSGVLSGTHPVLRAVVSRGRAHAPPHGRLDMYGLMIH